MNRRENTFRIEYANVPKKPSFEELHNFIGEQLGLKREEIQRIQCSKYLGCVFVKTNGISIAQRIVDNHDGKHELVIDNKRYPIRIQMEDGGVYVKLYDLSEDIQDQAIIDFLSSFGDVLSIRDQPWDDKYLFMGVSSGVRVARMIVKRNIPSFVTIDGETTCLSFNGQITTCRHCSESTHNGISCIQNKKLLIQKLAADQANPSYANVAKQSAPARKHTSNFPKSGGSASLPSISATSSSATNTSALPLNNDPAPPANEMQTHGNTTTSTSRTEPKAFLMPPPAFPSSSKMPSTTLLPESTNQHQQHRLQQTRPEDSQRGDGHDTDDSTTSSRRTRGRPHAKKNAAFTRRRLH